MEITLPCYHNSEFSLKLNKKNNFSAGNLAVNVTWIVLHLNNSCDGLQPSFSANLLVLCLLCLTNRGPNPTGPWLMVRLKMMNGVAKNRSIKKNQQQEQKATNKPKGSLFLPGQHVTRPSRLLLQLKAYAEFITALRPVLLGPIEVVLVVLDSSQTFNWSHDVNVTFTNTS